MLSELVRSAGKPPKSLSSPRAKNIPLNPSGKSPEQFIAPSVQPLLEKYSDFQKFQISPTYRRLVPTRGALRGRHERWVRDAVDVEVPLTNGTDADGEVVWS
ncbi:hypothetical protein GALL_414760 [mine drainage metagenome]|uniref:Uncharacterized protein n=1 Tax=mine drainage metagenome TaxID=410659 RepID=A0A1J5QH42_9ZZZZ